MYRALASPSSQEGVLAAPTRGRDGVETALAYWTALLHLLIYGLGWARPDRGLKWWYEAGKPVEEPELGFISEVWDADGQLDWFAAWFWTTSWVKSTAAMSELTGSS